MPGGGSERARVAFFGNVANSHFRAVSALRTSGLDAHLFISASDGESSRPESSDPDLARGYPDWIHCDDWITPFSVLRPKRARITRQLSEFDVVVASGPGPVFAQFCGRPWAFMVTGGDLTVKPFPLTFLDWYPNWAHRVAAMVAGAWQRRASRRATQVWLQPFAPMLDAADRLSIPPSRRMDRYFPLVVDTTRFSPDAPVGPDASSFAGSAVDGSDFVVFHPSRLVMDRSEKLVRTGQWKGNDRLLRGFADFVRCGRAEHPVLVMPDIAQSRDRDTAKRMVSALGIDENVRWMVPPDGRFLDSNYMVALYQHADVVCDEFGVGWFGYVTLEAMAMGRPVLSHVDTTVMDKLYPDNPIVTAREPREIAVRLQELFADPCRRTEIGEAGRKWALRFHSPDGAARVYLSSIDALLAHAPDTEPG